MRAQFAASCSCRILGRERAFVALAQTHSHLTELHHENPRTARCCYREVYVGLLVSLVDEETVERTRRTESWQTIIPSQHFGTLGVRDILPIGFDEGSNFEISGASAEEPDSGGLESKRKSFRPSTLGRQRERGFLQFRSKF